MHEDELRIDPKVGGALSDDVAEIQQFCIGAAVEAVHRRLKQLWREHPVAAVAAAIGLGLIFGTLIGGRR